MSTAPLREVPLRIRGAVEQRLRKRLDARLRQLGTLGDVLAWCRAQDPELTVAG